MVKKEPKKKKNSPVRKGKGNAGGQKKLSLPTKARYSDREKESIDRLGKVIGKRNPVKLVQDSENSKKLHQDTTDPLLLRAQFLETTGTYHHQTACHLMNQAILAMPGDPDLDASNAAVDMMNGIQPKDPLEGMLATQMVAVHNMALECSKLAMVKGQHFEARDMSLKHAAKLMQVFTAQVEALNKYRTKGQQTINVQHVNVNQGGQAVVGNIQQGGGDGDGSKNAQ